MIVATLGRLSAVACYALVASALPSSPSASINENAACSTFGEWQCDSTGQKLVQCAYDGSNALVWYWSGAACSVLPKSPTTPLSQPDQVINAPSPVPAPAPVPQAESDDSADASQTSPSPSPSLINSPDIPEANLIAEPEALSLPNPLIGTTPAPQAQTQPVPTPTPAAPVPVPQADNSIEGTSSSNIILSGKGSGTYYYDYTNKVCPGFPAYPENNGITSCESSAPPYRTLSSRQTNDIVAIAIDQLSANKAGLCGKRVIVKYNGVPMQRKFFVWDACLACTGGVKLDFSLSALSEISDSACQLGVVPGISWDITDEQVIPYVP
ncbi:hypothetical protein BCR33DRAFT_192576 [Rhizoclosmatium globosum]|uniref:RlpA-like protein double-psi beta-barrel domain-containing protein n=1 Tax=Rhizoclosmatium globosum TaxID=329046 RepID=A0A1Y2D266_9FUNG|nr:hypothetical protein BCR33DRAFT_192576 [Rhizoclosmatium globosum]|eukprot:ORY53297.1 hypothetical protein BCR33DRAFT_192576 [Rhizoclosmatium globosum]